MFESFLAVPLHFTVEFLGFLVAVGAALLAASRPGLVPGPRSNRVSVALGFGALAVAQVLHGGSFDVGGEAMTDGADVYVSLQALGFALILIGVVGTLRPSSAALVAGFSVEEPLLLAPAGAAFLVAIAAYSTSHKEDVRAYRQLALAMLAFALSSLLTSAAPDEVFGSGTVEGFAYAAHAAKTLGYVLVGAWFWSAIASSIRIRFVASFGALLVAVILTLSTALTGVISNNVESEELDRVESQARNATSSQILDITAVDLSRSARAIAGFNDVAGVLANGGDPELIARFIEQRELFNQQFIIVDPKNALPGFVGQGPSYARGDRKPKAMPLTRALRLGLIGSRIYLEVDGDHTVQAVGPVRLETGGRTHAAVVAAVRISRGDKALGTIALGTWLDDLYMQGLADPLSASATLIKGEALISSTLPKRFATDIEIPESLRSEFLLTGSASEQLTFGGRSYFNGFSLLEDNGREIGTLVISSEATVVASTRSGVNRLLFLAAMLVGAIALALAWLSGRRITRPIQQLTLTAALVREGDLTAQAPVVGNDEVGQLGETFNEMTASLLKMTSDLRLAAREEHALRSRIETIIQSMADGLVAVDAAGNVLAFNREAEHLTGIPASEAIGMPIAEIVAARDAQGQPVRLPVHDLAEGAMGGIFLVSRDTDPIPVAITSAVLRSEDEEIAGAVAVLRDMTREREVERMKTEFLSNISHELRTPLTPIKGYAEILQRKDVPPEKVKQFVGGILESTGRLERIVELLVDFAAMEAGRMSPKSTKVDVEALLEELATRWGARASQHEVVTEVEDGLPEVIGDERLLKRSLEELLDNAVKFSPHGGRILLEATSASVDPKGVPATVEISISDEGIGILPEDLPKIFSDFQQLDGSETRTYGGLGLGLAYVRRIVQAHDGDVRVESEPDRGTKLTIVVPAATGSALDVVEPQPEPADN